MWQHREELPSFAERPLAQIILLDVIGSLQLASEMKHNNKMDKWSAMQGALIAWLSTTD